MGSSVEPAVAARGVVDWRNVAMARRIARTFNVVLWEAQGNSVNSLDTSHTVDCVTFELHNLSTRLTGRNIVLRRNNCAATNDN